MNSRFFPLILALAAAVVLTLLFLPAGLGATLLTLLFLSAFIIIFILVRIVFHTFVMKDLQNLDYMISPLLGKSIKEVPLYKFRINRAKELGRKIRLLLQDKEKTIDELEKTAKFRQQFISDASHELKSPIFAAQGYVHTLLDGAIKDKVVRNRFLKRASKNLDYMDMLVQDLLTLSQIETGFITMHPEQVDLVSLTHDVFENCEQQAAINQISLACRSEKKEVMVYADYTRIRQVMQNLVMNAIEYNKKNGKVVVNIDDENAKVRIEIRDTGIGIPEESLDFVFNRFFRVDKSRTKKYGGTGLGLAIVKHILENHGSKIKVKSSINKGSTFVFNLPKDYRFEHEQVYEDQ